MRCRLIAVALTIVCGGLPSVARSEDPILPVPPHQADPWTPPPTTLPKFLTRATATLFDQGLADPRGCDYRSITIEVGSVWGHQAGNVTTRGWVIPPAAGEKPRYAIAWSGLVYPLIGEVGPADLETDVRAIEDLAGDGQGDVAPKDRVARRRTFHEFGTNTEASSVAVASFHSIKLCLLLRLGRADLAEAVWAAGHGLAKPAKPGEPGAKPDLNSYGVSYLSLAVDLAWYHFDRAICAHMRGNDPIALADARALTALAASIDARAEAMGFARPDQQSRPGRPTAYIDFLDQLPELLADQERRAVERAHPPAAPKGEGPAARVEALVRDLDQVAARQWGQPGGVSLGESPILRELIELNDPAVEPLIQAFRSDNRLTRSVGFHRDFFRSRSIYRTTDAAYAALTGILKATNFAPPSGDETANPRRSRSVVADEIQAYWEKNRAIPIVERWYRTLLDDRAGDRAWLEAAGNIIQPSNVRTIPGSGAFTVTETTPPAPGQTPRLRGESLRQGHEPTVAALMARRVDSMSKSNSGQQFELLTTCQMASMLAAWDPKAGLPTLREMTRICRERYGKPDGSHDWTEQNLALAIARFTLARDQAGDPDALAEYAAWVRTTSPAWLEQNALAVLEPLYRRPDNPVLAATAEWLFGDPKSPWVPLIGRDRSRVTYPIVILISSPLVDVPAFRQLLIAGLADHSPIGRAEVGDNGSISVKLESGFSMGQSGPKEPRDVLPKGAEAAIRTADFYAWQLATLPGAPAFNPVWPEPRRDEGIASLVNFLNKKGARP